MTDSCLKPLALTIGEPAGIGPDIAIMAWSRRKEEDVPPFYVIGDADMLMSRAQHLGYDTPISSIESAGGSSVFPHALPVLSAGLMMSDRPGEPDAGNAKGVIAAIERAVVDLHQGVAAAIVTAPIAKKTLYDAGFAFPGHTEFLGHLAQELWGWPATPIMMLAGPRLRAVPVTIHIPLAAVPGILTIETIVQTARIVAADLQSRFAMPAPRLAISGLNPHAGEGGTMGSEEIEIIEPAIAQLRSEGHNVAGPLPADTMFHAAARARYDAAICMYHDQALIAAKALDFEAAVNVTLGLPFIRTSPDHGTAFDIAGTGKADPSSLIAALKMAREMASREDTPI